MKNWMNVVFAMLMAAVISSAASAQTYKLIAHPTVRPSSLSREEVSRLFLKKVSTWAKWGSDQKVVPFDLAADSSTREGFSNGVHKRTVPAIKSYWQQQIFSGRGTPPAELAGDAEMISSVSRTAGAIGYVSSGATLPGNVKEIRVAE